MKLRKSRHKHSTWVRYRQQTAWARAKQRMLDYVVVSATKPGFSRRILDPEGSARIMAEASALKAKLDAEFAALPRPTIFK